eukprot:GHRQ01033796.1.p1 GENE.GHRQ01033796.1~~GHRQ01033796.1.p1  ORF type:complete len:103 (-),score=20.38 GHRQ01033796.1:243-551(-)
MCGLQLGSCSLVAAALHQPALQSQVMPVPGDADARVGGLRGKHVHEREQAAPHSQLSRHISSGHRPGHGALQEQMIASSSTQRSVLSNLLMADDTAVSCCWC